MRKRTNAGKVERRASNQINRFSRHPLTALMLASGLMPGWTLANTINIDGNTQTHVTPNGTVTDITTDTVRGKAGFNSFYDFKVNQGNTVNLHVPGAATHLVNLVRDSRVEINGTLNGLKNGAVGGHIIFADPHGFVVGSSGVVNVGSLTVSTPSVLEMDQMVDLAKSGSAADANAYVDRMVAGQVSKAGGGAIIIDGMVNTNGSINLHGASVLVGATGSLQAGTEVARAVFDSTVNTNGLAIGAGIERADGGILITAADGVTISGELAALMADDSGASVRVNSIKSIELNGDAAILASGQAGKDGGDIILEAPSITIKDQASLVTRASGEGSAGDITLNALSDISCTFCDESASAQTLDELKDGIENQANPWLSANLGKASISVSENALLDAGHDDAGERAGDVTLNAFALNRQLAGYAEATASIDVDGTLIGRDITLSADSRAEVARDIIGSLLNSGALKDDIAALKALNNWTEEETWANILDTLYEPIAAYGNTHDRNAFLATPTNFTELTLLVPMLSAYIAKADAEIRIGSTASLDASNDLTLWAQTSRNVDSSTWQIPVLGKKIPFGFSAAYGQISGVTSVEVEAGALLKAGRDLAAVAHSVNKLSVTSEAENSVDGNGSALKTMGLSFGMAMSDIDTQVVVAKGAQVEVGRDANITALTEQSLSNTVTFKASGEGATGGPAIGLSLLNSKTRAEFSANLNGARNLNLTAANLVHEQGTAVTVTAGASEPGYLDKLKTKAKEQVATPVTNYLGDAVKGLFGIKPKEKADPTPPTATDSQFRLASALGISMADHSVEAVLGSADAAPEINLTGDLSIQALQRQSKLHNTAESTVNASAKRDDGSTDGADVSLSVAAVYSELDQTTHAIIGDGANVTAARIGLGAQTSQLLNLQGLDRWSSLDEVYKNLKLLAAEKAGIAGKLATQYANSTGEADKLGMAGSLSILLNNTDTNAWVGDNVNLTATSADAGDWTSLPLVILPDIADDEQRKALRDLSWTWAAPISVHAENQLEQLAVAGNFDSLFGVTSDGGAVGAGLNIQITDNRAVAGIGAGGSITSKALDVSALQDELIIGLSPSAGKGASVAGNGSVVVSVVDAVVHASVHSSTNVTADKVNIDAEHQLGLWSASGALAASENVGIGAGVAVNVLNTDVYALVGDNNVRTASNNSWRPDGMGAGLVEATAGQWLVDELLLSAQSSGQSGAFAVAGALARSEQEQEQQDTTAQQSGGADKGSQEKAGSLGEAIKTSLTNGLALLTGEVSAAKNKAVEEGSATLDKVSGYLDKLKGLFDGSASPTGEDSGSSDPAEGFSLAAAASGSVNVSGQKNRAHLGNIVLDPRNTGAGSRVDVLSLNQTHQFSGSGAGALTLSGGGDKSEFSAALSGAIAYNHLKNVTEAELVNVTLRNNDHLDVQAASSGDQIALGLGLSVASGGETNVAVALSGSAGVFENRTSARVIDSSIQQRAAAPGSIAVNAYDRSRSLLGGGSFAVSTDKGGSGGGSVVIGVMQNQLEAAWLGSDATDFDSFELKANSASRVLAGALGVAVSKGEGASGSGAGSLFVVLMNNKVNAKVDASDKGDSSLRGKTVTVAAASVPGMNALDGIFNHDNAASKTLLNSGLDMDGSTTTAQIEVEAETNDELFEEGDHDTSVGEGQSTADTTTHNLFDNGSIAGEAVLGIAGSLAATSGKAAVGGAFGVVYTGSEYAAKVANTDIDLTGDLTIAARNETDVLAAAIGAVGSQKVAVSGSATALVGRGSVSAELDMTGRTLKAHNLTVEALKSGGFYSLAGSIAASSNTAAVGAAFSINDMQQGAKATITGGEYQLGGDAVLNAAQQSRIITAALSGAVSGSGTGVGAAMTYNRIADTTEALLKNVELHADNLNVAASQPNLGASIWSLAFNLAAGGGSAGVGAGVAVNLIDAERTASISDSDITLTGSASMESALDGEIWSIGIDAAGGGTAGVGGSFAFNNISGKDEVSVDNSRLVTTGNGQSLNLDASAGQGLQIASLAGSVTGGGTAAVGLAASVNRINAQRTARISGSELISGFANVGLKSGVEQAIYSIAVAGGGAGSVAVNGATTTNLLQGTEKALIEGSTLEDIGSLSVSSAEGKRTIWGLGLVLNGAGSVAVGASNVNNIILAKRIAEIQGSKLDMTGSLSLASGGDALIRSAALGAGGGGSAAAGASIAVNVVQGEETSRLHDSSVSGANALTVEVVRGEVDIKTLAGNVQGGGSGAGAGAVAVSTVAQTRQALISDSTLTLAAGALARVEALTKARIDTLALSGAGAGSGAVAFSNTTNNIDAKTYARVTNSAGSLGNLQIKARDASEINSLAGGVAAAGSAAVGVATAINRIANDIQAQLGGSKNNVGFALGDLLVDAASDARIRTASVSGGFSGTAAVSGGVSTSILNTKARALIDGGALVVADNNVAVVAYNRDVINSYAGVVAGSGNAAVTGLLTVNKVQSETEAAVRGSTTRVTALGKGAGVEVDNGNVLNAPDVLAWANSEAFDPVFNLRTGTETVRGLAVRATSLQQSGQFSVSAAVSLVPIGSASVGGLSNTSVLGGSTLAAIDQAQINQDNTGAAAAQQVSVAANSHSYSFGSVQNAALSLGAAAVAVTADTGVISRNVTALIRDAKITSRGQTAVKAHSDRAASSRVVSASGAIVGVAGSSSVLVLEGTTEALVDRGSVLNVGSLAVKASAVNTLSPAANTASGGAVGAGAAVGVGYNQSTVRAWLGAQSGSNEGRTSVITAGAVSVDADSLTKALVHSASASGGGAAMAGAVNVLVVENVTEAGAGKLDLGSQGSRAASLSIDAFDRLEVQSNAGSLAAGGVSMGASANVLVANNATRAMLLDSQSWVSGNTDVNARRESDIQLTTISGGIGGSLALGGSLGMIMLGSGATEVDGSDAMDELDADGKGTLSMVDGFTSRETAAADYKTVQWDANTGAVTVVDGSTAADADWLNQQGRVGSTGDRLKGGTTYRHETLARIAGGRVESGGVVNVKATDAIYNRNLTGSVQAGGAAFGGVVGFTLSNARVSADVQPTVLNASALNANAETLNLRNGQPAVVVDAYTGSAGFAAGLGAGVGVAVMNNQVSTLLGGSLKTSASILANASDALNLDVRVLGGQISAGGAAGIVIGIGERASNVSVTVQDDAELQAGQDIQLTSLSEGGSRVRAQGASGGLLAGVQAAIVHARDTSRSVLSVGNGAHLTSTGLQLSALARPRLEAEGLGVAVGGAVSMGGTLLFATADSKAYLDVHNGSRLTAHDAVLRAAIERNGSADSVSAHGVGVAGGLGLSANAVVARAINNTHSRVLISGDSQLIGSSRDGQGANWVLAANTDSRQRASTTGVTVGLLSIGAHVAEAGSTNITQAQVNGRFSGDLASVRVAATANNDSEARSTAGQGGLISGAASSAKTWDQGRTEADWLARGVGNASLRADAMVLDAFHTSRNNAFVDSTNAGLVGVSGAHAENTVKALIRTQLLSGSFVEVGDYTQSSLGQFIKSENSSFNVNSGSGGALDMPAAKSITNVTLDTQALVDNGARLKVVGDWRDPGHLVILAFNDIYARDKVKLDAGGAIAITRAESQVDVNSNTLVRIGENAEVFSIGNMTLAGSTKADINVSANTKAYGAAGAAAGLSLARVTAKHDVEIQSGAKLRAYGDVRLHAGADASGKANHAILVARTDLWNKTAFPVNTSPVAQAIYDRTQDITVASGALVESVADVYAYAEKGYGQLTGKGVGKDLYREVIGAIFGGLISLDINYEHTDNSHSSDVRFNGDVFTGIFNKQILEINRLVYDEVNETVSVEVGEVSEGVGYRLITGEYVQMLSKREEQLNEQLRNYGLSEQDRLAIEAERKILRQRMRDLYIEMGGVAEGDETVQFDSLPRDITIEIIEVDPIIARPGNIFVRGDRLTGTGNLRAPGDALIRIDNASAAFLNISNLEIPNRAGGQLLFNSASMTDNDSITNANLGGVDAGFASITVSEDSPETKVIVNNTYNPATGGSFELENGLTLRQPAPDININGAIWNLRGNVELNASHGSIYINGDVRAQSISISAGRDFVLNADDPFYHVGGDPSSNHSNGQLNGPRSNSGQVAGNNVVISAQYLNINGLLQSGVADWAVTINEADFASQAFLDAESAYKAGTGERYFQVRSTQARTGTVGYSYDFLNNNIVLDAVEVGGGYMELTGHIMSTGDGQINVMDGYSRVKVVNNSDRTLQVSGIDLGHGVEGTLRINDINYTGDFKGNDTVTSTIYTRVGNDVQVYRGLSKDIATTDQFLIARYNDSRDATYQVRDGRTYVWLTGQDYTQTRVWQRYVDKFWGLIKTGQWDSERLISVREGDPTFIPGADYMGNHVGGVWNYNPIMLLALQVADPAKFQRFMDNPEAAEFAYLRQTVSLKEGEVHEQTTTVSTDEPISEKEHWKSCAKRFIWCQITRYNERETITAGKKDIVRHTVRADSPINISFIGHDTGEVTLSSMGDLLLGGSIFNETGTTTLTGDRILQGAEEYVIAARDLSLNARKGMGLEAQALNVRLSGGQLGAVNQQGDVFLNAVNGGVHLNKLSTQAGNINLTALGNITTVDGTVIAGHAINLTSTQGSIGALGSPLLIDTNNTDGQAQAPSAPALFTAKATGNIVVEEVSGDLALNQVISGGDTWIKVRDGDLLDANNNDSYDERSLAELQELWNGMQLSGEAADEALEQQKQALENAGNARYSRYWQLRNLRLVDGEFVSDAYDPDFQASLSDAQVAQLREFYEWDDQQLDDYRTNIAQEYQQLHAEFGGNGYSSGFSYQLSADEVASVEAGSSWTNDQLLYSISRGLMRGEGGAGSGKIEELNIDAHNITLIANKVGSTLAEDVVIDLSNLTELTLQQRAALAGAESDNIIIDENNPNLIRIIQREDVDVAARGNIQVTANEDVFLGGTTDFNIFDVKGDRIEIKTDGSITSANGSNVVIRGNDVILDAGSQIGTDDQALHLKIMGVLSARAQSLALAHEGDLKIDYLLGRQGINLSIDQGNLTVKDNSRGGVWQEVEHIAGGNITLQVDGSVGGDGQRLNLANNPGDLVNLDIAEDAWIGGIQGVASQPGILRFNELNVGGRLDLANLFNLQQTGNWTLGSLAIDVQNDWLADVGKDIVTSRGIIGQAGNRIVLGNLSATNAGAGINLTAATLEQSADDLLWDAAGLMQLQARGDVGKADRYLGVRADELNVRSDNGDLYLRLIGLINSGELTSLNGSQWLDSRGDVRLDQITLSGALQGSIEGRLQVGDLDAGRSLSLDGEEFVAGNVRTRGGDITLDLERVEIDTLNSSANLNLQAGDAVLGEAQVAGVADLLVTRHLELNSLRALDTGIVTGTADVGSLHVTGDLSLDSDSDWSIDLAEVSGNAALSQRGDTQADNSYGVLEIGGLLSVNADGHVQGQRAEVQEGISFDVGSADLGSLLSRNADLDLLAQGLFSAQTLSTPKGSISLEAGSGNIVQASSRDTIDMLTHGNLVIGQAESGLDMTLKTSEGSAGDIRFGQPVTTEAELDIDHLYSAANMRVEADGDLIGGNAAAQGELFLSGRNIDLGRAQSYTSDVQMRSVADIDAQLVKAHRDIGIIAGGTLTMSAYEAQRLSLSAGRDLLVGLGGNLNVGGYAEAGRDIVFDIAGDIGLLGMRAGRDITVRGGGLINIDEIIEAGGDILLEAVNSLTVGERITADGDIRLQAGGLLTTPEIDAGGLIHASSDQGMSLGNLTAGQSIDLLSGGFINVSGTSSSVGNQNWLADEDIQFNRLLTQGQALLDSLLDTRGSYVRADQGLTANAGWRNGQASAASLILDEAVAPTMSLWSGQSIQVADASIGSEADLHAQDIEFNGRHTGEGELTLHVEGLNNTGAAGDRFVARLDAEHVVTNWLDMLYTELDTTALRVDFLEAQNVDYLFLTTPQAVVLMDNISPAYRADANVQLHELDKSFWLLQNGLETYTNGYVLHRDFTHLIRVPNFAEGHEDGNVDYQRITAADYSVLLMTPQNAQLRLGHLLNEMAGYAPAVEREIEQDQGSETVNTDWQKYSSNSGEEVQSWEI